MANRAQVALVDWLERRRWSKPTLAEAVGVSRQFIDQICEEGGPTPGLTLAAKIEEVTGIPASHWVAEMPAEKRA